MSYWDDTWTALTAIIKANWDNLPVYRAPYLTPEAFSNIFDRSDITFPCAVVVVRSKTETTDWGMASLSYLIDVSVYYIFRTGGDEDPITTCETKIEYLIAAMYLNTNASMQVLTQPEPATDDEVDLNVIFGDKAHALYCGELRLSILCGGILT